MTIIFKALISNEPLIILLIPCQGGEYDVRLAEVGPEV